MLKRMWRVWMRMAMVIGNFNSRVVLTVFYALVVLPFGVGVRLFGDPLAIKKHRRTSSWTAVQNTTKTIAEGRKQY